MTGEQEELLYALSAMLMHNNKMEAEAVKGYTEQLDLIRKVREACAENAELVSLLNRLEAETVEKTQDELNHGNSLYREYTELTGIEAKEE